jgi:hypothetical protein
MLLVVSAWIVGAASCSFVKYRNQLVLVENMADEYVNGMLKESAKKRTAKKNAGFAFYT